MKRKINIALASIFTIFSVISTLMFCGYRIGFVFVDHEVKFNGFCYMLWAIFIVNTIFLFLHLRQTIIKDKFLTLPLFIINCVIAFISVVASIAFLIIGGEEEIANFFQTALTLLPYLAGFYLLLFFIFIFPHCGRIFRYTIAAVAVVAIIIPSLVWLFPVGGLKIENAPAVFDTGNEYKVVFATNRKSIGYVTYKYNGQEYIVYDTTTGRKDSSLVHSVSIPYEHLNNNAYSINAQRAWEDIAYGGNLGKKISTLNIDKFTPCKQDDFNMLCITDTHSSQPDWNKLAGTSDICVFLGDIANGIYSYDSFVDNLIAPAGIITGGKSPSVYVRGNHDHRGKYVPNLLKELDFDQYYYRIQTGKYTFTVVDSGEDKADDNYEYAGYNDYASYKAEQIQWLQSLDKVDGYNVMLAHDRWLFDTSQGAENDAINAVKNFGADFIICGHSHRTEYKPAEESDTHIQYYICGGKDGAKDIKYTIMNFNNGIVQSVSKNMAGEEFCKATIKLAKS